MFGGSPTQQAQPASASAGANLLGPAPAKAAAPSPVPLLPPRDEDPWRGWGPVNREGGWDRDRDRRVHRGFQDHRHHSGANYSAVHDPIIRVLPQWLKQVGDELIQEDQSADFITGGSCLVVDTICSPSLRSTTTSSWWRCRWTQRSQFLWLPGILQQDRL